MTTSDNNSDNMPIAEAELDVLFATLVLHDRIAVGVSGGSDSTALLHLLARWYQLRSRDLANLLVLTVDHGLRPESREEAEQVARQACALGLDHRILAWRGEKPVSGVQAAARDARYDLMTLEAKSHNCTALVIAHTLDDQAETLLMRLARGSGLDGLAGMAEVTARDGVEILRPLLGQPKARLTATLNALGVGWTQDPSNEDLSYERVRVRKALGSLAPLGIDNKALGRSAARLARARVALEDITRSVLARIVDCHRGAMARIDGPEFFTLSDEIRMRFLGRVISAFGGRQDLPQMAKLEKILAQLDRANGGNSPFATSLGGTLVRLEQNVLFVFREPARGDIDEITLVPGSEVVWDGRFLVTLGQEAEPGLVLGALGKEGIAELGRMGDVELVLPEAALMALPALRQDGRLVFVPLLDRAGEVQDHAGSRASQLARFEFLAEPLFKGKTGTLKP